MRVAHRHLYCTMSHQLRNSATQCEYPYVPKSGTERVNEFETGGVRV
jgi:hypothetical protein